MRQGYWTEEVTSEFLAMASAGVSYGEIARVLSMQHGDVSRAAVISKAHRAGLPRRSTSPLGPAYSASRASRAGMIKVFQGASGQRTVVEIAAPVEVKIEGGVTLLELRDTSCRWPLWGYNETPDEAKFCGTVIDPTHTYCAEHRKLAYQPRIARAKVSEETRMAQRLAQIRRWNKTRGAMA